MNDNGGVRKTKLSENAAIVSRCARITFPRCVLIPSPPRCCGRTGFGRRNGVTLSDGMASRITSEARLERPLHHLQRLAIAVGALPRNRPGCDALEHGVAAPFLARADVGQVDLDGRQACELDGVADRVAVVSPGAGVEQGGIGDLGQAMEVLHELALVVGLEKPHLELEGLREALDLDLELPERDPP